MADPGSHTDGNGPLDRSRLQPPAPALRCSPGRGKSIQIHAVTRATVGLEIIPARPQRVRDLSEPRVHDLSEPRDLRGIPILARDEVGTEDLEGWAFWTRAATKDYGTPGPSSVIGIVRTRFEIARWGSGSSRSRPTARYSARYSLR